MEWKPRGEIHGIVDAKSHFSTPPMRQTFFDRIYGIRPVPVLSGSSCADNTVRVQLSREKYGRTCIRTSFFVKSRLTLPLLSLYSFSHVTPNPIMSENWSYYNAPPQSFDPNTGEETMAAAIDPNTPANISFAEYVAIGEAIDAIKELQDWRTATTTTLGQIQSELGNQHNVLQNIQAQQGNTATSIRNIEALITNLTQQTSATSSTQPPVNQPSSSSTSNSTATASDPSSSTSTTTTTTTLTVKPPSFTQPDKFKCKSSDVEYFIREMTDAIELLVLRCQRRVSTGEPTLLNSFSTFVERFKDHFGDSNLEYNTELKLKKLKQMGSAADYASRFSELVVHVDWSESTKINQFYTNLKTATKDQISQTKHDEHLKTFLDFKKCVIDIDNRVHEREEERKEETSKSSSPPSSSKNNRPSNSPTTPSTSHNSSLSSSLPPGEPMQVDATKTANG
ncbi:hypothetical protein D9758_000556 [Tetrapyrgos nigripes]|uniref:Retrotransposon gag domain-containing protein n=1 Tax=Tetrapyrgos nigripes TaxID=182062 RepID=A0A8H5LZ09_9AGAR|nr:hypothetical protein D9758_000556 [Tetrapyrgos nigripes]